MKQLASLAWKEWHEVQAFFWVALFVFIGLPMIGGIEALAQNYARNLHIISSTWVYAFGGVLAVFVAAGTTCRDFQSHLEDFWRSRPVSIWRWLLVKYAVGLAAVLIACVAPLIIEAVVGGRENLGSPDFDYDQTLVVSIIWLPFFWAALYSLAFLAGCLVRRTAHAAMLGLAAMLLVYTLPMLVPPLEWMNVQSATAVLYESGNSSWPALFTARQLSFGAGMLGIAIAVAGAAIICVRRGWLINSGRKMMYGSVSAAVLLLCTAASYRLGTNLPVLQQVNLPMGEYVDGIRCDGHLGLIETFRTVHQFNADRRPRYVHSYYTFDLTTNGIKLGQGRSLEIIPKPVFFMATPVLPVPTHPQAEYSVGFVTDHRSRTSVALIIHDARSPFGWNLNDVSIPLWSDGPELRGVAPNVVAQVWNDRVYVIGSQLAILDISKPFSPRIISMTAFPHTFGSEFAGSDPFIVPLPPVPDLPPRAKLEVALKVHMDPREPRLLEGDTLCTDHGETITEYRLTKLDESRAVFRKVGEYRQSRIERTFGAYGYRGMQLQNGLLYVDGGGGWNGFNSFNGRVSVFDTRSPNALKLIGHFAAPGSHSVLPLPDGRAIVGGDERLWLVGAPPAASNN